MHQTQALACLSALSHHTRLAVVRLLVGAGPAGLPAGVIGARLEAPASRLSFHLTALEQAGLIGATRNGRQVIYAIRREALGGLIGYLVNDCACGGAGIIGAQFDSVAEGHPPQLFARGVAGSGAGTANT